MRDRTIATLPERAQRAWRVLAWREARHLVRRPRLSLAAPLLFARAYLYPLLAECTERMLATAGLVTHPVRYALLRAVRVDAHWPQAAHTLFLAVIKCACLLLAATAPRHRPWIWCADVLATWNTAGISPFHLHMHNGIFVRSWCNSLYSLAHELLGYWRPMALAHVQHHHKENNAATDQSSLRRYDRTCPAHFAAYFVRMLWFNTAGCHAYYRRQAARHARALEWMLARLVATGALIWHVCGLGGFLVQFVAPFLFVNLMLCETMWWQHGVLPAPDDESLHANCTGSGIADDDVVRIFARLCETFTGAYLSCEFLDALDHHKHHALPGVDLYTLPVRRVHPRDAMARFVLPNLLVPFMLLEDYDELRSTCQCGPMADASDDAWRAALGGSTARPPLARGSSDARSMRASPPLVGVAGPRSVAPSPNAGGTSPRPAS